MKPLWRASTPALVLTCAAFTVLSPSPTHAQLLATRAQGTARFEFNFSNPGARSLAMGGAFAALADDATAAYANPAGLTNLSRPEVSIEGRSWRYEVSFLDAETTRNPEDRTDIIVPIEVRSQSQIEGVSFFSLVYPYRRWTFAAYRHELANFTAEADDFPVLQAGSTRAQKIRSTVDLSIVGHGLMGAYLFERYGLSIGLGAVYYDSSYNAFELERRTRPGGTEIFNSRTQGGQGQDWAANVGIRWRLSDRFVVGTFYRQGPEFPISELDRDDGRPDFVIGQFRSPDVFGFGLALQPVERLWINAEYNQVAYSQISEDRGNFLGKFVRDDAKEIRLGLEYSFWNLELAPAVRLGAWYDPDHALRFEKTPEREDDPSARDAATRFPAGEDEIHLTAGFGIVVGQHLQLDAGYDFADSRDTGSLSMVFRF